MSPSPSFSPSPGTPGAQCSRMYLGVQCLVDSLDDPSEHALVQALGEGSDGVDDLLHVASLLHILRAHPDAWLDQRLDEVHGVDAHQVRHFLCVCWCASVGVGKG